MPKKKKKREALPDSFSLRRPVPAYGCLRLSLSRDVNRFTSSSASLGHRLFPGSIRWTRTQNILKCRRRSRWRRWRWRQTSGFSIFIAGSWSKWYCLREKECMKCFEETRTQGEIPMPTDYMQRQLLRAAASDGYIKSLKEKKTKKKKQHANPRKLTKPNWKYHIKLYYNDRE